MRGDIIDYIYTAVAFELPIMTVTSEENVNLVCWVYSMLAKTCCLASSRDSSKVSSFEPIKQTRKVDQLWRCWMVDFTTAEKRDFFSKMLNFPLTLLWLGNDISKSEIAPVIYVRISNHVPKRTMSRGLSLWSAIFEEVLIIRWNKNYRQMVIHGRHSPQHQYSINQ